MPYKSFDFERTRPKESLKIQKGYSEAVNQRKDNTMAKWKREKGQTIIMYKTLYRKLKKQEQHEPYSKPGIN